MGYEEGDEERLGDQNNVQQANDGFPNQHNQGYYVFLSQM